MDDPENREGDHGVEDMINLRLVSRIIIAKSPSR